MISNDSKYTALHGFQFYWFSSIITSLRWYETQDSHLKDAQITHLLQLCDALKSIRTKISGICLTYHLICAKNNKGSCQGQKGFDLQGGSDKITIECKPSHCKIMTDIRKEK